MKVGRGGRAEDKTQARSDPSQRSRTGVRGRVEGPARGQRGWAQLQFSKRD